MNILVYSYDHIGNPYCGGGGAYRTWIIHKMLAPRHRVSFYFGWYRGATAPPDENVTVKFLGFGKSYLVSRITFSLLATIHSFFIKPDCTIVEYSVFSPVFAFLFRPFTTIVQIHHLMNREPLRKYGPFGIFPMIAEKILLSRVRYIITSAESVSALIRQQHPKITARATYNGIDDSIYSTSASDGHYLLSLGRLDIHMKGLDLLLDAFDRIAGSFPDHTLRLAGRGNDRDIRLLQKRIAESPFKKRIELFINISNEQKIDFLRNATFGCMPSRFEGWNIVAIETAASSKATLGTNILGLRDTIKDGITGLLIPPENVTVLAEKMTLLLNDASLRERLGKNGYTWAKTFSWEKVTERQEAFYLEMLKMHHHEG